MISGRYDSAQLQDSSIFHELFLADLESKGVEADPKKGYTREVNMEKMPQGPNNRFIENLSYKFYMTDYFTTVLEMTDADNERWSIPEDIVPKPMINTELRLEMAGIKVNQAPFWFSFSDLRDTNNVFLTTEGQSLVFMDKYIQVDLKLPSTRIYGIGERVREFNLTQGTWTMWARGQDSPYDAGQGGR